MYEVLLSLWQQEKIKELDLDKAILKGWITKEEKENIMNKTLEI